MADIGWRERFSPSNNRSNFRIRNYTPRKLHYHSTCYCSPDYEIPSLDWDRRSTFVRPPREICYAFAHHRSSIDAFLGSVAHRKRPSTRKYDGLPSLLGNSRRRSGFFRLHGMAIIPCKNRFDGSGLLRGYCLCWFLSRLTSRGLLARGFFLFRSLIAFPNRSGTRTCLHCDSAFCGNLTRRPRGPRC